MRGRSCSVSRMASARLVACATASRSRRENSSGESASRRSWLNPLSRPIQAVECREAVFPGGPFRNRRWILVSIDDNHILELCRHRRLLRVRVTIASSNAHRHVIMGPSMSAAVSCADERQHREREGRRFDLQRPFQCGGGARGAPRGRPHDALLEIDACADHPLGESAGGACLLPPGPNLAPVRARSCAITARPSRLTADSSPSISASSAAVTRTPHASGCRAPVSSRSPPSRRKTCATGAASSSSRARRRVVMHSSAGLIVNDRVPYVRWRPTLDPQSASRSRPCSISA